MLLFLALRCIFSQSKHSCSFICWLYTGRSSQLFCYYSSYAQNRPDAGKFLPEDINADLCTHIIFTFADIMQGTKLKASGWNDLENGKDAGAFTVLCAISQFLLQFFTTINY